MNRLWGSEELLGGGLGEDGWDGERIISPRNMQEPEFPVLYSMFSFVDYFIHNINSVYVC